MPSQNPDMPSAPRDHSGKVLLLVVLAAVLVVTVPAAVWVYRSRQYAADKKVLDEQIARIKAAGDPLTLDELNASYRIPAGETDLTDQYIAALRECEYDFRTAGDLPIVGAGDDEIPLPPQPWPQLEQAERFLSPFAEPLAQLKSLARQHGVVRYPTDLDSRSSRDELHMTRRACRLLALEIGCHVHRGNYAAVTECVIAIGGIADTLRHQPESSAYLVRAALWGIAQEALVDYILDPQFPITELEALQKHFAASRWDDGYVRGLVGDRVLAYEMLGSPLRDVFDEGQLPGTELRQVLLQTQPRECGEALGMLSDIIDAARSSSDELHVTHQLVYDALHAKVESGATKLKSDEQQAVRHSNESLPFWVVETNPSFPARYLAQQRATVVMLAIERFRREQGKLPSTLGDLVPRYLDEVPGDPFDDQPLRFLRDGDRYTIYSVGTDLNDDLGALGYAGGRKDIGLSIPRLKK